MSQEADEMLAMLLDSADAFLADRHDLGRLRIGREAAETAVDPAVWRQMADLGWLGLGLPEAMDGPGIDIGSVAAICERLGRSLLPEPLISAALMPGALLAVCPPGDRRDTLAQAMADGTGAMTIAWQETPGGVAPDLPAATFDAARLAGRKLFVPFSLPAMTMIVSAQDAGEPVLLAVPFDSPGVSVRPFRMGDGGRMAEIIFDDVIIDEPPLARGPAAIQALQAALAVGTIALSAQLTGQAEGALALMLDYLRTRTQFGKPIGAFQALQHRAVDLYLACELAKAAWRRAAGQYEHAPGDPATAAAIGASKVAAARAARLTSQAGMQIFGAMGFTEEADAGLYLRSAMHLGSWLGGEALHRRRFLVATREAQAA